jgi:hypothetical protein
MTTPANTNPMPIGPANAAAEAAAAEAAAAEAAAAKAAAAEAAAKTKAFVKKLQEKFQDDTVRLKMGSCMVIFDAEQQTFTFQSYGAEKGISCYRHEAIKVGKMLPTLYGYTRLAMESLEQEARRNMEEGNDPQEIEGCVFAEIIQKKPIFEKRLEIQIYNQNVLTYLTLYKMKTDDGIPRPCSGSVTFREGQDDPQQLHDFIMRCMPKKGCYKTRP